MAYFSTCRVCNLPKDFEQAHLPGLFSLADQSLITGTSLALDVDEVTQTGTVTFRGEPSVLHGLAINDGVSKDVEYKHHGQQVRAKIDVNFHGLTPLNKANDEGAIVLVAVTGLAGRAFGSWQAKNGMMWLRDFLPRDVGDLRIFTYGYPSKLFGSHSTARMLDFTSNFMDCMKGYLKNHETARFILVGHSLGCLIIKQALCECELRSFSALKTATLAVLFFGPPHRGLNNPQLQDCVLGTPPEMLVQDLRKGSSVLIELNEMFSHICGNFKLITCYELMLSRTIRVDENGKWKRDGTPEMMVDRDSACLYMPNEKRIAMQADHSAIAKMNDNPGSHYHSVKESIANVVEEIFGTRSVVLTLFQHCLEVYEALITAVQEGDHLRIAYQLRVEVAKLELWARLSELKTVGIPVYRLKKPRASFESAGLVMMQLLDDLTDQNKVFRKEGENLFSFPHTDAITPRLLTHSNNTWFPPSRAALHQIRNRANGFKGLSLIVKRRQDALYLLDILRRNHNSIVTTLPSTEYGAFDQLLLAALLRSETFIGISDLEQENEGISSDVARSATLKLLGMEMRSGILHRLKSLPSLKVPRALLDLSDIPKDESRFVTRKAATSFEPESRVLIEWRYYDKGAEIAKNGDIHARIGELMKILTLTPRPSSLCTLDYQGFFHDFNQGRFGFVSNLPEDAPARSTNQPYRTLDSLLRDEKFKPSLTDRFDLSKALIRCVHQFHLLGWLHKGINCRNILFFDSLADRGISIRQPYVTGFDLSREDSPIEISETNSDHDLDIYRYVKCRGNAARFSAAYDIYALGILLLQVGYWRPLDQMAKPNKGEKTNSASPARVDRVLPTFVEQVGHRAGDHFFNVLNKCVQAPTSGTDFMTILEECLIELDRCYV